MVCCSSENQASLVCGLTARPRFDSSGVDHDIFILDEYFSTKQLVHCFPTPPAGNLSPSRARRIWSTCSLSLRWLNGNPRLPTSPIYSMMTSVSSSVNQDQAAFASAQLLPPSAPRIKVQ